MQDLIDYNIKMILVGNSGIGKTSIIRRYKENTFSPEFLTTIGIDFVNKIVNVNGLKTKLQIWDTAGQERFRSITRTYYKGTHCIGFVFDLHNKKSFKDLKFWLEHTEIIEDPVYILIGSKADLNQKVDEQEIIDFADKHKMLYAKTSAKNPEIASIDEMFNNVAAVVLKKHGVIKVEKKQKEGKTIELTDKYTLTVNCCN
jgi:Ras-related protein Rab-1A